MRDGASINAGRLAPTDLGLYAVTVFVWGTSWIALKGQLGEVSPEVSTLWRFLLAAPLMWLWALARGDALAYPAPLRRRRGADVLVELRALPLWRTVPAVGPARGRVLTRVD